MPTIDHKLLPPSCKRIANAVGGTLKARYEEGGLICYRTPIKLEGDNWIVEEGWEEMKEMPNGRRTYRQHRTSLVTVEWNIEHL
jgi:hypothetical protein